MKFKIPNSIIGATFIGFGTSAPELFASTGAAINGDLDLAIGNIVGSNIANSLLVVAVYIPTPVMYSSLNWYINSSSYWKSQAFRY